MAGEIVDYWPRDFPVVDSPAPVALLEQQAELLRGHTGGLIEGVVKPHVEYGTAYYSLYLKADALGDYLYKLLYIQFPADRDSREPFPIMAQGAFGRPRVVIDDVDGFRDWLRDQLSSDGVKIIIGNLLRYIRESRRTSRVS